MANKQRKNIGNPKASEKGVTPGFVQLKVNDHRKREANGRIPTMMTSHLYRQNELTLFTEAEEKERDLEIAQKAELFGFLSKNAVFDNSTIRTLYSLCFCLTKDDDDDILNFSKLASESKNIPVSKYVTRVIPIKDFVKFMFGSRGLHDRAIGVIKDIITLSSIPVSWQYEIKDKDGNTQKWRKIAPFINYEIDLPDANSRDLNSVLEDIYNQGTMSITIGRPLLQNLEKRFATIPKALITEWGKGGTQNEIFPILLNEMFSLIGNYRSAALKLKKRLEEEHKKNSIAEHESKKIIDEKLKEILTCRILFKSIAENSVYDYVSKGRWDRMKDQVEKNMVFFRDKIALITYFHLGGKGSNQYVDFIFNLDYPILKEKDVFDPALISKESC